MNTAKDSEFYARAVVSKIHIASRSIPEQPLYNPKNIS